MGSSQPSTGELVFTYKRNDSLCVSQRMRQQQWGQMLLAASAWPAASRQQVSWCSLLFIMNVCGSSSGANVVDGIKCMTGCVSERMLHQQSGPVQLAASAWAAASRQQGELVGCGIHAQL
jgi:hypothetical protein